MPRARLLFCCVLVCSDRFGVRVRIDVTCCDAPYGTSCFLFYRPRESMCYSRGKRGEGEGEEVLQDRRVLLFLHVSPADPVDVNRDSFSSQPCPSLAPCAGVVCRSWRSTPSWRTSWRTDAPVSVRTRVRQNSAGSPDAVPDVSLQVWPVTTTGHIGA